MKFLVLAVLCLSSLAYADGTPDKFEFTAPAWPRNPDLESAARSTLGAVIAQGDFFAFTSANEELFTAYYQSDVKTRDKPRELIAGVQRGMRADAGISMHGTAKDAPSFSESDNAITMTQHYALPGRTVELRVITTMDSVGILHSALGVCAYPTTIAESDCRAALASLQNKWPITDRTALDAKIAGKSQVYVMVKLIIKILIMVTVLGTISFLIRRKANTPA